MADKVEEEVPVWDTGRREDATYNFLYNTRRRKDATYNICTQLATLWSAY
jgi:hypothetical protein